MKIKSPYAVIDNDYIELGNSVSHIISSQKLIANVEYILVNGILYLEGERVLYVPISKEIELNEFIKIHGEPYNTDDFFVKKSLFGKDTLVAIGFDYIRLKKTAPFKLISSKFTIINNL